jgi:peptidoglycan/LPS O-acetylase OafA/YrhL
LEAIAVKHFKDRDIHEASFSAPTPFIYRPEIDGLRALAILSVILFHAGFSTFSGGFVGVDIFFVISGYLISSIILKELDHQSFSFYRFYLRRIKRIFPALILVLILMRNILRIYELALHRNLLLNRNSILWHHLNSALISL